MPSPAWSQAPVRVSPLIKLSRWSMLGLGIFWGMSRYEILSKREADFRAKEEAERPAREAAKKAEKDRKYKEEMDYLGRETGVIPGGPSKGGSGGVGPAEVHNHGVGCGCMKSE